MKRPRQIWFVEKGGRVQGPFSQDEIRKFLMLGRVCKTDKVSVDGRWEQVNQVPEIVPEEMINLDNPVWVPPKIVGAS